MFGRFIALGGLALAAGAACSSTTDATGSSGNGTSGGASTTGATAQQVSGCKEGCDKMKFFGCNSAEEQAACYEQCGKAEPSQIELFTKCAQTSICDPACRTNITPKPAPDAPPVKGTGATPSSCATACDKLVTCSFIKVADKSPCVAECEKEAYQYQIDCVNNNACDKLQSTCGGGGGGSSGGGETNNAAACQAQCDSLLLFECLSSTEQAGCRSTCSTATATKRDAFTSCAQLAGPECTKGKSCYSALNN